MRALLKLLAIAAIGLALAGGRPRGGDTDPPGGTNPNRGTAPPPPVGGFNSGRQATKAAFDKGEAGGSGSDSSEDSQSVPSEGIDQTGGSTRPREGDYDGRGRWAEDAYEYFRQTDQDIAAIADNLSEYQNPDGSPEFTESDVEAAKNNLMVDEHLLTDYDTGGYSPGRFDASDNIASAWTRLANGEPHPSDIVLLRHEIAEAQYFSENPGAPYSEAHQHANSVSDWQSLEESGNIPYDRNDYKIFG